MISENEAAVLARVIEPEKADLSPAAARAILEIEFNLADQKRESELATKDRVGTLTTEERAELATYARIRNLLDLLKTKARASLENATSLC